MPKKEDSYGASELGHWNVAARFAEVKIMIPLEKCDFYEDVAKFGHHSYIEQMMGYGVPADVLKITALNRLVNELMKIAKNSMFAMKKSGTKDDMEKLIKKLKDIIKILPLLSDEKRNEIRKTSILIVDKKLFPEILERVLEIKSEINFPLNKNHLIFTDREDFDPKAAKELIKSDLVNIG